MIQPGGMMNYQPRFGPNVPNSYSLQSISDASLGMLYGPGAEMQTPSQLLTFTQSYLNATQGDLMDDGRINGSNHYGLPDLPSQVLLGLADRDLQDDGQLNGSVLINAYRLDQEVANVRDNYVVQGGRVPINLPPGVSVTSALQMVPASISAYQQRFIEDSQTDPYGPSDTVNFEANRYLSSLTRDLLDNGVVDGSIVNSDYPYLPPQTQMQIKAGEVGLALADLQDDGRLNGSIITNSLTRRL